MNTLLSNWTDKGFKASLLVYFLILIVPLTPFFTPELFLCLAFALFLASRKPDWAAWWNESVLFWLLVFCLWMSLASLVDGFFLSGHYRTWFESQLFLPVLVLFKSLLIRPLVVVFLLYHLIADGDDRDRNFVKGLLFLVLVKVLVIGYVDYLWHYGWQTGHHFSAYAHYNLTATLVNIFFPFVLYQLYAAEGKAGRFVWIIVFYASVNAVYMTQSRGGIIAMFFSLILFTGLFLFARFSRKNLLACNGLALGVVLCLIVNPAGTFTKGRFDKTTVQGMEKMVETGSPVGGLSGRLTKIWPRTREAYFKQPVLGYSLDSYRQVMFEFFGDGLEFDPTHPHNFYLQLLFEGGIIGFVLFHLMVFWMLKVPLRLFVDSSFEVLAGITVPIAVVSEIYFHGAVAMFDYYWLILLIPWVYLIREGAKA